MRTGQPPFSPIPHLHTKSTFEGFALLVDAHAATMARDQCGSRGGKEGGQEESAAGDDVRSPALADVKKSVGRVISPGGL